MKKYRVKSAVYNEHNEHMLDHFGQEAYDIDTTIEEVLPDHPDWNWQDRRYY